MPPTRRDFLRTITGAATLSLADISWLRSLAAFDEPAASDRITFGPDIEPIVRLIEETPRERCVEVFIDQLRHGLPYRRFLAAVFFASIRREYSHHEIYKVHAVHQVSADTRTDERLLPLFWAINGFKQRQEDFPARPLTALKGSLPTADKAAAELVAATERGDQQRAELAIVALARSQGARQTMEQLWLYGC